MVKTSKVAIIILNWNGYQVTKECLISLAEITYKNYKIILIDNGSKDDSVEKLSIDFKNHDKLDILALDKNYGFTGGNNKGILYAKEKYNPEFYLLLNNDTIVDSYFLENLVNSIQSKVEYYAAVPKIYYFDKKDILWYAGGSLSKFTGMVKHFGFNKKDSSKYSIKKNVTFMNGCSALIKKNAIDELGLLDERFFANSEDADYSIRILNSSHLILYVPESVVFHKVSYSFRSNKGKWFTFYMATRNIIFLQKKYRTSIFMPIFYLLFGLRWMAYLTVKLSILKDYQSIRGIYLGFIDGVLNNTELRTK